MYFSLNVSSRYWKINLRNYIVKVEGIMGKGKKRRRVHMVWPDVCMPKCPHSKLMRDPSKLHKYNQMKNLIGHPSGRC